MTDEQREWVAQLRCYLDVLQGDPGDEAMLGVQIREVRAVFAALDAARAREQALAETFNERVNWIQVVEARWRSAEAREASVPPSQKETPVADHILAQTLTDALNAHP